MANEILGLLNKTTGVGVANLYNTGGLLQVRAPVAADTTAALQVNTGAVGSKGLVVQRYSASQSANLTEWQMSDGLTTLATVNAAGKFTTTAAGYNGSVGLMSSTTRAQSESNLNENSCGLEVGHSYVGSSNLTRGTGSAYTFAAMQGAQIGASFAGTATTSIASIAAVCANNLIRNSGSGSSVIDAIGVLIRPYCADATANGVAITRAYGVCVMDSYDNGANPTPPWTVLTTQYGLYVDTMIKGVTNYGVYVAGNHSYFNGDINITGAYKVNGTPIGSSGTVTSITGGTGLSGGTITTSGTLSVNYGSTSGTAAEGNHNHSGVYAPNAHVGSAATAGHTGLGSMAAASTGDYCGINDSRLTNARTPTAHNHAWSDINSGVPGICGADYTGVTTWSPVVGSNDGLLTFTNLVTNGVYTVIGKVCFFTLYILWDDTNGAGSGYFYVNMPIEARSGFTGTVSVNFSYTLDTTGTFIGVTGAIFGAQLKLHKQYMTPIDGYVIGTDLREGASQIDISGCYIIN